MAISNRVIGGVLKYQVRVRDRIGRLYPCKTFYRKVDARFYEQELKDKKNSNLSSMKVQKGRMLFSEYWNIWSKDRRDVSDGWKISQNQLYKSYIEPQLGAIPIKEISTTDINGCILSAKRIGRAEGTQLHIYSLLHKMFSDAIELFDYLSESPVRRLLKPRVKAKAKLFLKPEQSRKLLNATKSEEYGVYIWISLLTGMRVGEVQALRWEDVDLDRKTILIQRSYARKTKRIQDYPKQGNHARAAMPDQLCDFLAERKLVSKSDLVLDPQRGEVIGYELT